MKSPKANTSATVHFDYLAIHQIGNLNSPECPLPVSLRKGGFDQGGTISPWGLYDVETVNASSTSLRRGIKANK